VYEEVLTAMGVTRARVDPARVLAVLVVLVDAMPSFTVIVPALNEEKNLGPAVETILTQMKPLATALEVLVYDDASTDRTGAVADELAQRDARVRVVHNRERLNIGGIYKAGVQAARAHYVLLVPGDNEMRMDEIARGIKYLDRADLVVFYVTNVRVRSWWRRLSRLYAAGVNVDVRHPLLVHQRHERLQDRRRP